MRAVPRDVNASLFKQQQSNENGRASKSLPRSTRLSDAALIRSVLAQKPKTTKYIACHIFNEYDGFALTVPKKLAKRAVDRNKIKRLMREAYRQAAEVEGVQAVVLRLRKKLGIKPRIN